VPPSFSQASSGSKKQKKEGGAEKGELLPGYAKAWCSSGTKKGYSGTAIFFKKDSIANTAVITGNSNISNSSSDSSSSKEKGKGQKSIASFFGGEEGGGNKKKKTSSASSDTTITANDTTTSALSSPPSLSMSLPLPLKLLDVTYELPDPRFQGEVK
jgi:hypothetical protein